MKADKAMMLCEAFDSSGFRNLFSSREKSAEMPERTVGSRRISEAKPKKYLLSARTLSSLSIESYPKSHVG